MASRGRASSSSSSSSRVGARWPPAGQWQLGREWKPPAGTAPRGVPRSAPNEDVTPSFSAVRRGCDARDALRSAVRSGQALWGLANPLQESSCSLFQIPSLNWLIQAGRSVWWVRQRADTGAAAGEGRPSLQGRDRERLVLPLPCQTSACSPGSLLSKPCAVLGHFPCSF